MNVYQFTPDMPFSGGALLVAASTLAKARKIAREHAGDHTRLDDGVLVRGLKWHGKGEIVIDRLFIE